MIVFDISYIKSSILCNLTHCGEAWFVYGSNPWDNKGPIPDEIASGAYVVLSNDPGQRASVILKRCIPTMDYKHGDDITIHIAPGQFIYLGGNTQAIYQVEYRLFT